jgi:CheY-like chemotaxis protein
MWKTVQSALQEIFPTAGLKVEEIAKSPTTAEVRERPLVLVIDDDPDVVKFLEKRLRKCGVSVLSTTDGIRGYRMARREKPSVILSDYFMPEGDINFLLWRLRSTPGTEKIPVIAMTARNLDKNVEENLQKDVCGQRGVERIFRKPLDIDALFTALQQYCAVEYTATAE